MSLRTALALASLLACAAGGAGAQEQEARGAGDPHRRRSTLYVADRASSEVIALSRDTMEILATIKVGRHPSGLAARSDGDRIYVVCAGSHTLHVIDGATRELLDTIALTHGSAPAHIVLGPLERTLYIAASGTDRVLVFEAGSLQQVAEISVGRRPTRLAISPDGRRLYVLCVDSGRVDIVDTAGLAVLRGVPVGTNPGDLSVDETSGTVYVVRPGAPILHSILDGASQASEISIDSPAEAVAVDDVARRLVLASPASGRISIVSPLSGAATKIIPAEEVSRLVLDPEGSRLYALSARRGLLLVVDRIVGVVEREVPAGKEPWDLVLIP